MELTAMKSFNQSLNMHETRNHERFRMIWRAVSKRFLESETIRSNYRKTVYHGGEERDKPGTNPPLDTFPQNGLEKRPFLWQKQDGRSIVNLVIDDAREWTKVALKYWNIQDRIIFDPIFRILVTLHHRGLFGWKNKIYIEAMEILMEKY